jgi:hypothetical protein
LNRALEGLARLRKRGAFSLLQDCDRAVRNFLAHANPFYAFLDDDTLSEPTGHIVLQYFCAAMAPWEAFHNEAALREMGNRTTLEEGGSVQDALSMAARAGLGVGVVLRG